MPRAAPPPPRQSREQGRRCVSRCCCYYFFSNSHLRCEQFVNRIHSFRRSSNDCLESGGTRDARCRSCPLAPWPCPGEDPRPVVHACGGGDGRSATPLSGSQCLLHVIPLLQVDPRRRYVSLETLSQLQFNFKVNFKKSMVVLVSMEEIVLHLPSCTARKSGEQSCLVS